jgi:hypothetical protein
LVRSYLTVTKDLARVKTRLKAIYRSWAIPCDGKEVYAACHRAEWLAKIKELGVRRRAEFYYQELDGLRVLRLGVRRELVAESKKQKAWKRLCQIPAIGPLRAAVLLGILSPWRGGSEQISFIQMGCEARKLPAVGEIFFLTSTFIELPRTPFSVSVRVAV